MNQTPEDTVFAPPYMSFETFKNFVQRLNPQAMPPRIDRTMMVGMAGGTQTALIQLLRQFDLIGDANEVRPQLIELCSSDDAFATGLQDILERHYAEQLELGRRQGTPGQLAESFADSGYTGSTLRKAVTFFLHAARAADLPLSPHFRPPKASPSPSRSRRTRATRPVHPSPETHTAPPTPGAESHTIQLASGGTVTVSCSTSFLALTRHDRDFLFELVDKLKDYAASPNAGPQQARAEDDLDGSR